MMLIEKLFEGTILVPMRAKRKEEAIKELLTHLLSRDILSATVKLFENINEQEKDSTSSAGRGIAYPHSTSIEIDKLTCVLGVSPEGINFNSPDGHDCHLILLTLSPSDSPIEHRKFITRFRSMVDDPIIRSSLNESVSSKEIINIITKWEEDYNGKDDLL